MNVVRPTVLLVEDDPNDVLLMQRAFRKAQIEATLHVVPDGEIATHYILGTNDFANRLAHPLPCLVLLDLKLPRKSGLEVLAIVREQSSSLKRLPVVMMTSSRQAMDINRAYDLGANSYLVKPGGFDALLEMIKTLSQYWFVYNQCPDVRE
jgi:DNA-binding response OmpR family regulator